MSLFIKAPWFVENEVIFWSLILTATFPRANHLQ